MRFEKFTKKNKQGHLHLEILHFIIIFTFFLLQYIIVAAQLSQIFLFISPETFLSANPKFQTQKPPSLGSQSLPFLSLSLFFFFSVKLFYHITKTEPTNFGSLSLSLWFSGMWMRVRWTLASSGSRTLSSSSVPAKKDSSWLQGACTKFGKEVM